MTDIDTAGVPATPDPIDGGVCILNGAVPPGHPEHELWRAPTNAELSERQDTVRAFVIRTNQGRRAMLRIERNRRLTETDWTELPSAGQRLTAVQLSDWAAYRQALRDLPAATVDPDTPPWPPPPGPPAEAGPL